MYDILIRNGKIMDGTGNPWFPADVGIVGDTIAEIGNLSSAEGELEINAAGKIVCPGFVDCHSHTDRKILANRQAASALLQGVTTEIVGNCGKGPAPITETSRSGMEKILESFCPSVTVDWSTCGEYLDRLEEGIGVNLGYLVGHETIRRGAMGVEARAPSEDEMQEMERLVAESLDAGAIGLSFGLEFLPGRVADSEELRRLCRVAAARHKPTAWHVRNRDRRFLEAVREAIQVTRNVGARLQLSHLSAKPGSSPRAWNRVMEEVRLARAKGHDVQCDMIPYTIGPGRLSTILPDWATEGAIEEIQARLRDPETREKLKQESDRYWFLFYYREWDKVSVIHTNSHPDWIGMTFREIGEAEGKNPFDCVYDLLADEAESLHAVGVNGVLFSEGDIVEWLSDPLFSIASDGFTAKESGKGPEMGNHPACYGWTPRVIQRYVDERRIMSLEEAVRKMSSMPAARFDLYDRGVLRKDAVADVIVFSVDDFQTRATYQDPHTYAEGMSYVIVNGELAVDDGEVTDGLHGRVLGR
jgi:N-acyl-D-amino-acid deacylase